MALYAGGLFPKTTGTGNVDTYNKVEIDSKVAVKNYSGPFRTGPAKVGDQFQVLDEDGKTVSNWTPKADIANAQALPTSTYYNLLWRIPVAAYTALLESGKIPAGYFTFGTTAGTVAEGNHTHSYNSLLDSPAIPNPVPYIKAPAATITPVFGAEESSIIYTIEFPEGSTINPFLNLDNVVSGKSVELNFINNSGFERTLTLPAGIAYGEGTSEKSYLTPGNGGSSTVKIADGKILQVFVSNINIGVWTMDFQLRTVL